MKYLNFILFISLCSLSIYSCKDDNPQEPAYTSIAPGTLQAIVDGEEFFSENVTSSKFNVDLIKINASAITSGISIITTSRDEGNYSVGGVGQQNYLEYSSVSSVGSSGGINLSVYTTSEEANASGMIRILNTDLQNKTVSGTFEGTLVLDTDPSKSIIIEDGLFNQVPY